MLIVYMMSDVIYTVQAMEHKNHSNGDFDRMHVTVWLQSRTGDLNNSQTTQPPLSVSPVQRQCTIHLHASVLCSDYYEDKCFRYPCVFLFGTSWYDKAHRTFPPAALQI